MIESECACTSCVRMCRTRPCLPTPYEAELLKQAHPEKLMTVAMKYRFSREGIERTQLITSPAIRGREGLIVDADERGTCVFLESDRCLLHGTAMKPLEGRLANHSTSWHSVRAHVVQAWIDR